MVVKVGPEIEQLVFEICRRPEQQVIQILSAKGADEPFHEWMGHGNVGYGLDFRQLQYTQMSKLVRNVPFLTSLEMSPFSISAFLFLCELVFLEKSRARGLQDRRSPSRSTWAIPRFAGLVWSAALRSPQGGALRAKWRTRPAADAMRWQPTWGLASAPRLGPLHATDGLPTASTSAS